MNVKFNGSRLFLCSGPKKKHVAEPMHRKAVVPKRWRHDPCEAETSFFATSGHRTMLVMGRPMAASAVCSSSPVQNFPINRTMEVVYN